MSFVIFVILFVPGFLLTYVFFERNKIDMAERVAISFALSIAIFPLMVFCTNLAGLPITRLTIFYQIILILSLMGVLLGIKKVWRKK